MDPPSTWAPAHTRYTPPALLPFSWERRHRPGPHAQGRCLWLAEGQPSGPRSACPPARSLRPNLDSTPKPRPLKKPPLGRPQKPLEPAFPPTISLPRGSRDPPQAPPLLNARAVSHWAPGRSLQQQKERGQGSNPILAAPPPHHPCGIARHPTSVPTSSSGRGPGLCICKRPGNSALEELRANPISSRFWVAGLTPSSRYTEPLQSEFPAVSSPRSSPILAAQVPRHGKERRACLSGWRGERGAGVTRIWKPGGGSGRAGLPGVRTQRGDACEALSKRRSGPSPPPDLLSFHTYLQITCHQPVTGQ